MTTAIEILIDGATYSGSLFHSSINYALLADALAVHGVARFGLTPRRRDWIPLAIGMALLQVLIWFAADAEGVSLVWAALYGHAAAALVAQKRLSRGMMRRESPALILSLAAAVLGYLFYAVDLPPVTTVAHSVAAAVGAAWYLVRRRRTA